MNVDRADIRVRAPVDLAADDRARRSSRNEQSHADHQPENHSRGPQPSKPVGWSMGGLLLHGVLLWTHLDPVSSV
jgi:hypothetical protein